MGVGTRKQGSAAGELAVGPRGIGTPARPQFSPDMAGGQMARALAVVDYADAELQSLAASGGVCQVQLDPLPAGLIALVDRIFVSCDSTSSTTVGVFVGGTLTKNQRDYAPNGNINVADYSPALYVGPTKPLIVRWEGASAGAIGIATLAYRVCRVLEVPAHAIVGMV